MGSGCSVIKISRFGRRNLTTVDSLYENRNGGSSLLSAPSRNTVGDASQQDGLTSDGTLEGFRQGCDSEMDSRQASAASNFPILLPGTSMSLSQVLTEDLPDLESKSLPDLQEYPEFVRNLLLGRLSQDDNDLRFLAHKEIHLLVINDTPEGKKLKTALELKVFPDIRRQCAAMGYDFLVMDFDLSHRDANGQLFTQHFELLHELLKVDKLLILVLADSAFLRELEPPLTVSESDFDEAITNMPSADDREVFHSWYLLDKNSVPPCYRIKTLLRTERAESRQQANDIFSDLVRILNSALVEEATRNRCLRAEIEDILEFCVVVLKDFRNSCLLLVRFSDDDNKRLIFDIAELSHGARIHQLFEDIESLIPADKKFNYTLSDEKQVCSSIRSQLSDMVKDIAARDEQNKRNGPLLGIHRQLYEELVLQQQEIHHYLKQFRPRPAITNFVRDYLIGPQTLPLIVHGQEGRGKSAILAHVAAMCTSWMQVEGEEVTNVAVLARFSQCSPESFTQEQILRSICEQWCYLYGEHPALASRSITEHRSFFELLLTRVNSDRPLVIIIDGLDQVEVFSGRSMRWLPENLPEGVKIVLGIRDGTKEMEELNEIFFVQDEEEPVFLRVPNLVIDEGLAMLSTALLYKKRCLTHFQMNSIKFCLAENPQPRYVHLLACITSTWESFSLNNATNKTFHNFVHELIDRANRVFNHLNSLPVLSTVAICALSATKHGLSDTEATEILSDGNSSISYTEWLAFKTILSPFFRTVLRKGIRYNKWRSDRYKKSCLAFCDEVPRKESLDRLSKYFWTFVSSSITDSDFSSQRYLRDVAWRRRLEETAFLSLSRDEPVRERFFSNPHWLRARISAGDPYDVLEDIKLYRRKNPDDHEFDVLREVIQLSSFALRCDGAQLYSQLHGRLRNFFTRPENRIKYSLSHGLFKTSGSPIAPSLLGSSSCLKEVSVAISGLPGKCLTQTPTKDDENSLTRIIWLPGRTSRLASFSSSGEEIVFWEARRLQDVTSSSEISAARGMQVLDHRRLAVLGVENSHLEIYDLERRKRTSTINELVDLDQGAFVTNAARFLFVISVSRTQILKISTQSGRVHCRMLAGDDRYLCNLTVNESGNVCVCGDALQKPYPLLIWKPGHHHQSESVPLQHELRIPHHEFFTRMAAISNDGKHYVTAAKNLLDSSPSYVVVYDTEKGELLWKKPSTYGVTGIGLCSETNVVIHTSENCFIYVSNLGNGECRFVLPGPSWAPDCIQTSRRGDICLTFDSSGRDRTIRIWNITSGARLASFTPDNQITCCALSEDGTRVAFGLVNNKRPQVLYLYHASPPSPAIVEEIANVDECRDEDGPSKVFR